MEIPKEVSGRLNRYCIHECASFSAMNGRANSTAWHIHWQAASGRDFLAGPDLHQRIRQRLFSAHTRPGAVLLTFNILPTEIHLLSLLSAECSPRTLARSIGHVLGRWMREAHTLDNPVLARAYRVIELPPTADLQHEVCMLAWRPIRLGLCKTPSHDSHSPLRIALGMTPADGFDARPLLRCFGATLVESRASLRRRLRQRPSEAMWRVWELTRGLLRAEGSLGPHSAVSRSVDGAAAALVAAAGPGGIRAALLLLETWVSSRLDATGALRLDQRRHPLSARGRAIVACLATGYRLCPAAVVARHFGFAKATLSEQMSAARRRPDDRGLVTASVEQVLADLTLIQSRRPTVRHRPKR